MSWETVPSPLESSKTKHLISSIPSCLNLLPKWPKVAGSAAICDKCLVPSWKMMLWKCSTQYASKFGKLNSAHRTGKGQFSFQFQRKVIPKNIQTTTQLHSSPMLAKQCSKFSKLGFNSTWTKNFQMFKLDLEKAEEPEITLPTPAGSSKKQESSRKKHLLYWLCQNLWLWITRNWKILQEMGILDHQTCLLRNLYAGQEATVRTGHGTTD